MKLRFSKEKFLDGLQQVQNVVSSRSTLPILSNTLIRANKDGVSLATTDLEVGVRCAIESEVIRESSTTLPARRLFTIIRELAHSEVEMEVDDKNIATIQCGGSHFKIVGLPEADFPQLPIVWKYLCGRKHPRSDVDHGSLLAGLASAHPVLFHGVARGCRAGARFYAPDRCIYHVDRAARSWTGAHPLRISATSR